MIVWHGGSRATLESSVIGILQVRYVHNAHTEPTLQPLQGEHLRYEPANGKVGP